ncbi:MAG: tRNA (N(6)-L-threonylcarbamoyladenosine(37)-C(2))-methylthiotransferase MtaB [Bacteroidetes bacterium]|nr:tRNA (N(6)-L-threonylcarbamoyladenosine(37)-C(2))-methylthiotransferase MtaB [Bacteroidota bacterium]MBV6461502.1 Threonylcarbamoyladenosine tRNA methylthiotransferase MtaB [Flavobacteriales bacterium]WKZ76502.1 MAG: tRNA (N(6)-L-threonylcarbamoyladenosine(37)-C(2))-methylthiotransferase MtaB [Vicingaceae bacterium]MCL4815671.1 tRNA (N(6)-L-threonylcarbamoyladenosine(37)-C(2))-methylthiotransferase MtaB [Flavobacteriales bacterium]NOG94186.1 tRNA (N(6)-L-threonylcarbamoyladenosine(37)-C(2))-
MNPGKKVHFYTLGCKLNFSESSTIARMFEEAGYARVDFSEQPDVYIINTCSVTENADKKCKQIVKKALQHNPNAFIAIIGCYAQLKPKEIARIYGVDMVLGANEKFKLLEKLKGLEKKQEPLIWNSDIRTVNTFTPSFSKADRTRSFLKIQDGCDYFCSFCTIPLARGKSRSNTIQQTLNTAQQVANIGVKEVVLTGVNIGDFGKQHNQTFLELITQLDTLEGIERYRISSIEPNLLTNEIVELVANSKKFAPHFHIPLQSGSDKILEAMRRKYKRETFTSRVEYIKQLLPDACIGADVIVGFPGETETDFLETYHYLNELNISYLHVFTYSERENTGAIKMKETVLPEERSKRSKMLHILSEKKKRAFYQTQLGKTKNVLFEIEHSNSLMHGFTENYIKVDYPYHPELVNNIVPLKLLHINSDGNVAAELLLHSTC